MSAKPWCDLFFKWDPNERKKPLFFGAARRPVHLDRTLGRWLHKRKVDKEQGVPAYVIFHDATLRQIAAESPVTLAELGTISGIGEKNKKGNQEG